MTATCCDAINLALDQLYSNWVFRAGYIGKGFADAFVQGAFNAFLFS
jgi:hypothetical protein